MGAKVTSGSLWETLGLAWCWKWRKFHQWAEKPCRGEGAQGGGRPCPPHVPARLAPPLGPCLPSTCPTLTFSCPITNCWATWFHRGFRKTDVWPRSCCKYQLWAWGERQAQGTRPLTPALGKGAGCLGAQPWSPSDPPSSGGSPTANSPFRTWSTSFLFLQNIEFWAVSGPARHGAGVEPSGSLPCAHSGLRKELPQLISNAA